MASTNCNEFFNFSTRRGGRMEHRQCLRLRLRLMNDATHSSLSFITQLEEETQGDELQRAFCGQTKTHATLAVSLAHSIYLSLSLSLSYNLFFRSCSHLRLTSMAFDEKLRQARETQQQPTETETERGSARERETALVYKDCCTRVDDKSTPALSQPKSARSIC